MQRKRFPEFISTIFCARKAGGACSDACAGISLIEVLVAVALISIVGVAIFGGLSTANVSTIIAEERSIGQDLAEAQMESIRTQTYDPSPPIEYALIASSAIPDGYSIQVSAVPLDYDDDGEGDDDGIQKITVTVKHHTKTVTTLEAYRVRR